MVYVLILTVKIPLLLLAQNASKHFNSIKMGSAQNMTLIVFRWERISATLANNNIISVYQVYASRYPKIVNRSIEKRECANNAYKDIFSMVFPNSVISKYNFPTVNSPTTKKLMSA